MKITFPVFAGCSILCISIEVDTNSFMKPNQNPDKKEIGHKKELFILSTSKPDPIMKSQIKLPH